MPPLEHLSGECTIQSVILEAHAVTVYSDFLSASMLPLVCSDPSKLVLILMHLMNKFIPFTNIY